MDSFEELGLDPALVEALAAEGIERPTAFQQGAVPVIRRGNNLVAQAGPGSGAQAAYAVGLLDRLEVEGEPTRAVVLTPTPEDARREAEAAARLAVATGHTVAALGSPWVLPERATVLFATPAHLLSAVEGSRVKLDHVQAVVLDGASALSGLGALPQVESLLEVVPADSQRVVVALPMNPELDKLVERHVRRAVHLPPRPVEGGDAGEAPDRGVLSYALAADDRTDTLLAVVNELLSEPARHVLVYFGSEDRAADVGDFLTLHGFVAGAPGDPAVPVWLGVDELEARAALSEAADLEGVATLSFDVPGDPDALDRRHGVGTSPLCLAAPRELPHLKDTARRAGYRLQARPTPLPAAASGALADLRERITGAIDGDLLPELLVLEPLLARFDPAQVAAATLALLRRGEGTPGHDARAAAPRSGAPARAWSRLFVSIGSRDGVGPGDLVGAISGESGIKGSQVGKIEIRESFSLVEVDQTVAEKVIRALNGTTFRGRAARVDYDRGSRSGGSDRGSRSGGPGRGPRGGGGRPPRGRGPGGGGGRPPRRDDRPRD